VCGGIDTKYTERLFYESAEFETRPFFGENRLYFLAGAGMRIVDLDTGEARLATLKELDDASVVSDAFESVHMVADTAPYTDLVGVAPAMTPIVDITSHLRNTTKITITDNGNDLELFYIKMARAVGVDILAFVDSQCRAIGGEPHCAARKCIR